MADLEESVDRRELENSLLLRGVDLKSIQGLLDDCPARDLNEGEVLIRAGQANHFLHLLLSGRLRVHVDLERAPIAILEPGEFVGELSLIDGQPTSASVVADQDCRLLLLEETTVWSLVDFCPAVSRNLLFVLAQRLRQGNALISTGKELQDRSERYVTIDPLTGLYNDRWLGKELGEWMKRCRQDGASLSLLLLAVDHFKIYGEAHGREAVDRVLYTIARILRKTWQDAGEKSSARGKKGVRRGNDEFLLLLPDTDMRESREMGERVRQNVSGTPIYDLDQNPVPSVTLSAGAALMTAEDTPETLIATAEAALHQARENGGNQVV